MATDEGDVPARERDETPEPDDGGTDGPGEPPQQHANDLKGWQAFAEMLGKQPYSKLWERQGADFTTAFAALAAPFAANLPKVSLGVPASNLAQFAEAGESLRRLYSLENSSLMSVWGGLLRQLDDVPSLTKAQDYATVDAPETPYSAEMESPASYFQSTEAVITSFDDLHGAITALIGRTPGLPLVWRGAKDAEWGLHSSLYRHLMKVDEVVAPSDKPTKAQRYPDEDRMVEAERAMLRIARNDWRFDDLSALETFARVQHAGGPTRLIDVTRNPYVAAWFAVELDDGKEGKDARLFALATRPVAQTGKAPAPDSILQLDDVGAAREPFWHLLKDNSARQKFDWGTGARRRTWVPPAYDPRISAQNAAFILDGVPMTSAKTAPYFRIRRDVYWRRSDLLASGSIYAKMLKPTLEPRYTVRNFAPTFSFRIKAEAKAPIREVMESRFGYRLSYIYPDMAALADYLKTLPLDG